MIPFWKLPIYTANGELVDYVVVPKFQTMPDVILWGSRVFITDPNRGGKYYEGFSYFAMSAENHPQVPDHAMEPHII